MRDALDQWLSREMQIAQQQIGPSFGAQYDKAPPWSFADCDQNGRWVGGALCASADKAGRRFPLIVAAPANDPGQAAQMSAACLDAIYQAFADNWDAEQLQSSVLIPTEVKWQVDGPQWALLTDDGPAVTLTGRYPANIISIMAKIVEAC